MRFTLICTLTGINLLLAGANPLFLPALLLIGYGIDHNKSKKA